LRHPVWILDSSTSLCSNKLFFFLPLGSNRLWQFWTPFLFSAVLFTLGWRRSMPGSCCIPIYPGCLR
jgi:hypothetical protein